MVISLGIHSPPSTRIQVILLGNAKIFFIWQIDSLTKFWMIHRESHIKTI